MTKRVIETALGTYVGVRGGEPVHGAYGWRGDEVDVHEDYLEEFDEHNVVTGTGEVPVEERVGVDVVSPKAVEIDKKAEEEAAAKAAEEPDADEEEEAPKAAPKKAAAKK